MPVWVIMIILAVISIASMLLAPKPRIENARQNLINDVTYPRATAAAPVPLILGTVQLKSANTIWLGDFSAIPQRVNTSQGGPLGIGTSLIQDIFLPWTSGQKAKQQTVGYQYYLGLDLALCLGGIGEGVKLYTIWAGNNVLWSWLQPVAIWPVVLNVPNTPVALAAYSGGAPAVTYAYPISASASPKGGPNKETIWDIEQRSLFGGDQNSNNINGMAGIFAFYNGDFDQPGNGYMQAGPDNNISNYGGFCHIVFQHVYVGNSTNITPFFFELQLFTNTLGIPDGKHISKNTWDINPVEAIFFLITSQWGGGGLSRSLVNIPNFIEAAVQVWAEDSGISLNLDSSNQVKDIIQEILRAIAGIMYQDPITGLINITLVRRNYDIPTLPFFDETNVLEITSFAQQTWTQTFNQMHVKFKDRSNLYADGMAEHSDFANIVQQGRIVNIDLSMPLVYDGLFAARIAARELANFAVPLYQVDLVLNRKADILRPGDVFVFNWTERGIVDLVLRVQKVKLGTLADGKITVSAMQDVFSAENDIYSPSIPSQHIVIIKAPASILTREVLEAPLWLAQIWSGLTLAKSQGMLVAFAKNPSSNSLNWSGYASFDNFVNFFTEIDEVPFSSNATLQGNYNPSNPGTNYDTTIGMTVVLDDPTLLRNVTDFDLRTGSNMFILNKEFMNYTSFVDHGDGTYTLQGIRRALLDTAPVNHPAGSVVWFLNLSSSLAVNGFINTGTTVYFKQIDLTADGQYPFISQPADTLVLNQRTDRPLRPAQIQANGSSAPGLIVDDHVVLTWRERLRTAHTLFWEDDTTQTPEAGQSYVVRATENGGSHFLEFPVSGTTLTYHFRSGGTTVQFDVYSVLGGLRSLTTSSMTVAFTDVSFVAGSIETRSLDTIDDRIADDIVFR